MGLAEYGNLLILPDEIGGGETFVELCKFK